MNLKRQGHLLLDIEMPVTLDLIKFLEPSEEATPAMEGDLWPTLQKVYMCFSKLKRSMEKMTTDSNVFAFLKKKRLTMLGRKMLTF